MKTKILGLVAAVGMLLATSCSQEQTADTYLSENELVDFSFSVGLEGEVGTRAVTRGDETTTTTTKISDGTRATELYFAIYDSNNTLFKFTPTFTMIDEKGDVIGEPVMGSPVPSGDETDPLYYKAKVKFPFTFSCQLVKGMDYKIVIWAQSGNAEEYYDMSEFPVVTVKYKDENDKFHANNDEMRDAFSVSYPIKASSVATSHTIVLTRPLSQINVGMTETVWDLAKGNKEEGKQVSFMSIENAATKFDIRANDIETNTNNLMKVDYQSAIVPFLQDKLNDVGVVENDRYLYVDLNHDSSTDEDEKFHWVSMCYILANDENKNESEGTYGAVIENLTINVCDGINLTLTNVPVKRNYRTNILFDKTWWATKKLTIELDRAYDNDDYNGTEDNGNYKEIGK